MHEVIDRVLAALWREVGREAEATIPLEAMAAIIQPLVKVRGAALQRYDVERVGFESVVVSGVAPASPVHTPLDQAEWQRLLEWAGRGEPRIFAQESGHRLVLPLRHGDRPVGQVVFHLADRPTDAVARSAMRLAEPFAVALENWTRHLELVRRGEALAAERAALLDRLHRDAVADVVVGAERGLRAAMEMIRQVAPTDTPVLLLGETGSGKEVLAREIHRRSRRAAAPVVRVNCGAIPPGLVDSELFGHDRGSFTGATGTRLGWFERADGGTLFLDEIGELPLEAQVRLLRILQDGTFERVGGHQTRRVDVRIVAATHRDLGAMSRTGRFREDLWYRIGTFPIVVPALRDRPEDLPELAAHFSWRSGVRLGGAPLTPGREDIELLLAYDWPGNVRELGAVIERAAILGDGRRLDIAGALGRSPRQVDPQRNGPGLPEGEFPTLDAVARTHIARALERTRGRIEGPHGAARLLGVNPHTLRGRMRRLGIDWRALRS